MENVLVFEITLLGNPYGKPKGDWSISEMTSETLKELQNLEGIRYIDIVTTYQSRKVEDVFEKYQSYSFKEDFLNEDSNSVLYESYIDFYNSLNDKVKGIIMQCDYISFVLESQN